MFQVQTEVNFAMTIQITSRDLLTGEGLAKMNALAKAIEDLGGVIVYPPVPVVTPPDNGGGNNGGGNNGGGNGGNNGGSISTFTNLVGCTDNNGVLTYTDGVINGTFAYCAEINPLLNKIYVKTPDLLAGDPDSFGITGGADGNFLQDSPDKTYFNINSERVLVQANNTVFIFWIKQDHSNASGQIIEIDFVNRKIKNVTANYPLVDDNTSADSYDQAPGTTGKPASLIALKQAGDVSLLAGNPVAIYQSQPEQA